MNESVYMPHKITVEETKGAGIAKSTGLVSTEQDCGRDKTSEDIKT